MTVYAFYIAYYIFAVLLEVFILKSKVVFYIVLFPLCFSNILILWQIVELFVNLYRFMCMCVCFPWRSVNFCSMLLASLLLPKLKHFFNRLKCLSIKYNEGIQTRYRSFIQKRGATHIRTHSVEKTAKVNERKRKPAKKQS